MKYKCLQQITQGLLQAQWHRDTERQEEVTLWMLDGVSDCTYWVDLAVKRPLIYCKLVRIYTPVNHIS